MASVAVLVNGIPGSGKSTLATALGIELGFPVVAKDASKELLADLVGVTVSSQRLGAVASDTMWSLAGALNGPVIIESFWASGRDGKFFERGVKTAGFEAAVEVWCEVSVETAQRRFAARNRHPIHGDDRGVFDWEGLAREAFPISLFPVRRVDTEEPVDVPRLAAELRGMLGLSIST